MSSLNEDISFERDRVLSGGIPESEYSFTLCPNIPFDASVPLRPALDNIIINCGQSANPSDTCALVGGTTQVQVESYSSSTFPVSSITLSELRFTGFSYAAIAGGSNANDLTTVEVKNSVFSVSVERLGRSEFLQTSHSFLSNLLQTNADLSFLVDQSTRSGRPFSVVVEASVVENVDLLGGFINNGGTLTIKSVTVLNADSVGALVSVNGNSGVLSVSGLFVSESAVEVSSVH